MGSSTCVLKGEVIIFCASLEAWRCGNSDRDYIYCKEDTKLRFNLLCIVMTARLSFSFHTQTFRSIA